MLLTLTNGRNRDTRDSTNVLSVLDCTLVLNVGHRQLSKAQDPQRRKEEMARHWERKV